MVTDMLWHYSYYIPQLKTAHLDNLASISIFIPSVMLLLLLLLLLAAWFQ